MLCDELTTALGVLAAIEVVLQRVTWMLDVETRVGQDDGADQLLECCRGNLGVACECQLNEALHVLHQAGGRLSSKHSTQRYTTRRSGAKTRLSASVTRLTATSRVFFRCIPRPIWFCLLGLYGVWLELKLLSCSDRALIGKHDQCLGQSGSGSILKLLSCSDCALIALLTKSAISVWGNQSRPSGSR